MHTNRIKTVNRVANIIEDERRYSRVPHVQIWNVDAGYPPFAADGVNIIDPEAEIANGEDELAPMAIRLMALCVAVALMVAAFWMLQK